MKFYIPDRFKKDLNILFQDHKKKWPLIVAILVVIITYAINKIQADTEKKNIYFSNTYQDFNERKILGENLENIYKNKESLIFQEVKKIQIVQDEMKTEYQQLSEKLNLLSSHQETTNKGKVESSNAVENSLNGNDQTPKEIALAEPPNNLNIEKIRPLEKSLDLPSPPPRRPQRAYSDFRSFNSSSIITFPVKGVIRPDPVKMENIFLPLGSYVKGKVLTGIEALETKTFPVLIQLDFAYVLPNQHKMDLTGCFMIAKAQGDLSTERVQMQADKLSCVSKKGEMFERKISGFVADDKDNSFAVMGSVNSKQDRVAAMGFISSLVEGISKAIQLTQTTQQMTPLGGTSSVVSGDQSKYLVAGGVSNAASMVTQWYLKQAQNLLPTINIGSGQDVWIVMQSRVSLPQNYFKKQEEKEGGTNAYSHFTRVID